MADGDGEGVCGIRRMWWFRQAEQPGHHELHLLLLRQPVPNDAGLDLQRSVFGHGNTRRGRRQKRHAAHLTQFDRGLGIHAVEDFLNGDGIGPPLGEPRTKLPVDLFQTDRKRLFPVKLDAAHGAADKTHIAGGLTTLHNPIARDFRPAVNPENTHRGQFTATAGTRDTGTASAARAPGFARRSTLNYVPLRDATAAQLDLSFEAAAPGRRVWPVSLLVSHIRQIVETQYADVWVEGEISNLRPAPSGHVYFTLKDADAQLPVVLFRRQALLLRFRPEDGQHVLARGRVSVYDQRGQVQLVAETLEPVGAGSLQLAFEQLKERLKAEGLFDAARKRPLPAFPRTVGIVTSPTGAVIRDFLNVAGRRNAGLNVLVCAASVQGESAAAEIESAIACLNNSGPEGQPLVDVIVVARGGGSLEDLAAFNSERVARAIAASQVPVVSAVGHETDFTIADFVADLRAPTPSAAAELITEAQHRIADHLARLDARLERAGRFQLLQARQRLSRIAVSRAETRITTLFHRIAQRLDDAAQRLAGGMTFRIRDTQRHVAELGAAVLRHDPRQRLAHAQQHFAAGRIRLLHAAERLLHERRAQFQALDARLHSLSPIAVLDRGYALVLDANGVLIRSAAQVHSGDQLTTRLADGSLTSRVESTSAKKSGKRKQ